MPRSGGGPPSGLAGGGALPAGVNGAGTGLALAVTGIAGSAIGCAKPLFPENAPRTQFEKFDSMRSGAAPAEEPDIFGRPQPALRARLTPKTND